jgi:DNA-binding MarR family transcriptional regulator
MEEWFALVQSALQALPAAPGLEWLGDSGLDRGQLTSLVVAYLCPSPFAFSAFADWFPYGAPNLLRQRLDVLEDKGLIQVSGADQFAITEQGLAFLKKWIDQQRAHLAALTPLPVGDLRRMSHWLSTVVSAALAAPPPLVKDCLAGSRRIAPAAGGALMVQIDQYLTDLQCFRDDAHISAWRQHKLEGPEVEVLTFLWRGEAQDLDGLSAALSERRGYSRGQYAAFVEALTGRGLVDAAQTRLSLTAEGSALREEIEEATERYYMFPWTALNPTDLLALRRLLERFTHALQQA